MSVDTLAPKCPCCGAYDNNWWDRTWDEGDGQKKEILCRCGSTYVTEIHSRPTFTNEMAAKPGDEGAKEE